MLKWLLTLIAIQPAERRLVIGSVMLLLAICLPIFGWIGFKMYVAAAHTPYRGVDQDAMLCGGIGFLIACVMASVLAGFGLYAFGGGLRARSRQRHERRRGFTVD